MGVTNRWILKRGRLHCKQCGKPSSDKSNGAGHSFCFVEPSPGIGHPLPTDPPMRLVKGLTSNLNGQMVRYLMQASEARAFDDLERRHPGWAQVYWLHLRDGETLVEIARRLGISYEATKKRQQRAAAFIRERAPIYEEVA